jgi:hypothetical protein
VSRFGFSAQAVTGIYPTDGQNAGTGWSRQSNRLSVASLLIF